MAGIRNISHLGVLCCFALFVCLTLLASFFLPSHLSFKNMHIPLVTAAVRPTLLEMSSIGPDEQSMACEHRYISECLPFAEHIYLCIALLLFYSVLYRTLPTLTGDPYESDEDDFTFYPDQSSSSEDEEEDSQYDLYLIVHVNLVTYMYRYNSMYML